MDPIFQVAKLTSKEVKARALKLYEIPYDRRNWSWLFNPNRATEPPVILRSTTMVQDDMVPLSDTDREEVDGDVKQVWNQNKALLWVDSQKRRERSESASWAYIFVKVNFSLILQLSFLFVF